MLRRISISAIALIITTTVFGQDFKKLPSSLEYKFVTRNENGQAVGIGDDVDFHIITRIADSIVFDSKKLNNDKALTTPVNEPQFNGDLMEGLALMKKGDVAIFRTSVDSAIRNESQRPPFVKSGDWMSFEVELVDVKNAAQKKAEEEAASKEEEAAIKKYIKENKLDKKVFKTESGLYYVITKKGTGENAQVGQTVSMNYTGYLLNGEVFDSNVDSAFGHVQPFDFPLGQGRVIKGWDEGIALLNTGAQAKLIIPSRLGYGMRSPSPKIPANSVLIFDVEMLGTK